MSAEVVLLAVTAALAGIAVVAAVVAVRALRELRNTSAPEPVSTPDVAQTPAPEPRLPEPAQSRPAQVVEGRVVATLTERDLLEARLSRPRARVAVYAHGLRHALRPESRDRITALMRREYRRRRAMRLKVARRALRSVPSEVIAE